MDDIQGIVATVVAGLALIGSLVARWGQTNKMNRWYIRLARVFDATQILDTTRNLSDD